MSYFAEIPYVGWTLPFLFVLSIVVFVHEYGHYIVGRWCGIRAEIFSIGFGPELTHWVDKRGMRWRVGMLPLGGFVKFAGDMNAASAGVDKAALDGMTEEERKGAFHTATVWRRALTVSAGPVANFILSTFLFAGLALWQGSAINEPVVGTVRADAGADIGLKAGDRVISVNGQYVETFSDLLSELLEVEGQKVTALVNRGAGEETIEVQFLAPARIAEVMPGGGAANAGLRSGDIVTAIDGAKIGSFEDLRTTIIASGGEEMQFEILRGGQTLSLPVRPAETQPDPNACNVTRPMVGVIGVFDGGLEPEIGTKPLGESLQYGAARTQAIITGSLNFLYQIIRGCADAKQLGGPIQIANVSGQSAEQGFASLIRMMALISASIGLINLFPIPVLDGGHLVFYAYEAIRGKPIKERWQEIGMGLGISLILLLMVFATYNDILRMVTAW
ncbi:MAG: RIP metalloprotease RseP [Pikeienuella sp.]